MCGRGKLGYATKALAEIALYQIRSIEDKNRVMPTRTYLCEECGRFHLTSKERTVYKAVVVGFINLSCV